MEENVTDRDREVRGGERENWRELERDRFLFVVLCCFSDCL